MGKPKVDLTGQKFGDWSVLRYIGNSTWECKCSCGTIKNVKKQYLTEGRSKSCGHNTTRFKDLTGHTFGEWEVLNYVGNQKWLCECSCGVRREVESYFLIHGKSKSCGHATNKMNEHGAYRNREFDDLTGRCFGEWEVLGYKGKAMWTCKCSCGNIKNVHRHSLKSGVSKSCGHSTHLGLIGKRFGRLVVTDIVSAGKLKCRCDCGNDTIVFVSNLTREDGTKSCGCINSEQKLTRDYIINKIKEYTTYFNDKPFIKDVENLIDRKETVTRGYIKEYGLHDYINQSYRSRAERDIANKFKGAIIADRTVLNPYELDIYVPDRKLAIEFNGTYWHSEIHKSKKYHQNKTIECAKRGIRLVHIFEYEWENAVKRIKIERFLDELSSNSYTKVYGRDTDIREIEFKEVKDFLEMYHLQGVAVSSINIGCYLKHELVGVMTFGKPRFNSKYQYELVRLCFKPNIKVLGGSQKMYKHFLRKYNPESVITYCDIAKFTGNVYTGLGFKPIQPNPITEPNYIWANGYTNETYNRYETQKHKLVSSGLGNTEQSEAEIMYSKDFYRIYDCGNLRMEWNKSV